jgi:Mrp family chromosome partitioning ATPase
MSNAFENTGAAIPLPRVNSEDGAIGEPSPAAQRTSRRNGARRSRVKAKAPYDDLLWRLQSRQGANAAPLTIGLVGCDYRAGVTTIAANLAVRAAELQFGPVLLVEADARRPRLAKLWKLGRGPGLSELLSGEDAYGACLCPGPVDDLSVLHAGKSHRTDGAAWTAGDVDALFAEACADHSLVFFDLPPARDLQKSLLLARRLDQALLVVRAESDRDAELKKCVDRLLDDGVPIAGAILNRKRGYVPSWLRRWA